VGTGRETSVNQLFEEMATQAGVEPVAEHKPLRPGELFRSSLDPSRAGIQLGWTPWTTLSSGCAAVLEFIRQQQAADSG
jgi:UDP-glucose 4-epimerase